MASLCLQASLLVCWILPAPAVVQSFASPADSGKSLVVLSANAELLAPGVVYTHYELSGPNTADVVSVRLRECFCSIETFRPESLTRVSDQVAHVEARGQKVLAAINGDFFSFVTHRPMGIQVVGRRVVQLVPSRRSHVVVTSSGMIYFGPVRWTADLLLPDSSVIPLDGINMESDSLGAIFFDEYGRAQGTASPGLRLYLERVAPADRETPVDNFLVSRVGVGFAEVATAQSPIVSFGENEIGHPSVEEGDTIRLRISFSSLESPPQTAVGGAGMILLNGEFAGDASHQSEGIGEKFTTDRHPRTFVAIDSDTSTLFLCTVDGRQSTSRGMNFAEMAVFLRYINAHHAVNLDGGGSSTLIAGGRVRNKPSDAKGERRVSNSLMIVRE